MTQIVSPSVPSAAPVAAAPLAKALKARLKAACPNPGGARLNYYVRVHRSLSWLQQAEDCPADMPDAKFLFLWIAVNSLYARWDAQTNLPATDHGSRKAFFVRILTREHYEHLLGLLKNHRQPIRRLLENPYLSEIYWRNPAHPKAKGWGGQDGNLLPGLLQDRNVATILDKIFARLAMLRGQLVHGAATSRSRLNRGTLTNSLQILVALAPALVELVISCHCDDTWPEVCYPPQPT